MRILCIGDSLGLAREEVRYEDTWFYKLQQEFSDHEFIGQFERGLLISKAYNNYDCYYAFYSADVVIIQTGICDCAPRYIVEERLKIKLVKAIFEKLGMINLFWKIVKSGGRKPTCVDTPINVFYDKFEKLVSRFIENGTRRIILVKIGHATNSILERNPFFNQNVDLYNKEIDKIADLDSKKITVLNPLDIVDDTLFVDGYHCNSQGMDLVYTSLSAVLETILKKNV